MWIKRTMIWREEWFPEGFLHAVVRKRRKTNRNDSVGKSDIRRRRITTKKRRSVEDGGHGGEPIRDRRSGRRWEVEGHGMAWGPRPVVGLIWATCVSSDVSSSLHGCRWDAGFRCRPVLFRLGPGRCAVSCTSQFPYAVSCSPHWQNKHLPKVDIFRVLWLFNHLFVIQSVITGWWEALRRWENMAYICCPAFSLGWDTDRLDLKEEQRQNLTKRLETWWVNSFWWFLYYKRDVTLPSVRGTGCMAVWDVSIKALLLKQIHVKPFELSSAQLEWLTNGS